ncbi:MAG: DUF554 domain-containing protein [Oscillospiraceae bacterium]|nr:DUF554 domain-containing protein [Oscillospiraceae bacterium]
MLGVLVNTAAIIVGGVIGLVVNKGLPKRFTDAIMIGIGLCVIYIGISGALQGENVLILVLSIVLGVATGTALRIDDRLNALGEKLEKRFAAKSGGFVSQGFVTGTLLFCVGAMAVIGSINAGIRGDNTMLFTKSVLDLVAAAMLAVSLGAGVILSAASVFAYQGLLVLLSQLLRPLMENPAILAEMTSAGSLIIIALGLNLIGLTKIKVADFLPAVIFAPVLTALAGVWGI